MQSLVLLLTKASIVLSKKVFGCLDHQSGAEKKEEHSLPITRVIKEETTPITVANTYASRRRTVQHFSFLSRVSCSSQTSWPKPLTSTRDGVSIQLLAVHIRMLGTSGHSHIDEKARPKSKGSCRKVLDPKSRSGSWMLECN